MTLSLLHPPLFFPIFNTFSSMRNNTLFLLFLFAVTILNSAYGQDTTAIDDDDDDDECAFISGQHCDGNGICKYCAMCLQSSCILSKTIGNNPLQQQQQQCNSTQFGTTNLYGWYDYCLSSGNDNSGGTKLYIII